MTEGQTLDEREDLLDRASLQRTIELSQREVRSTDLLLEVTCANCGHTLSAKIRSAGRDCEILVEPCPCCLQLSIGRPSSLGALPSREEEGRRDQEKQGKEVIK